MVYDGNAKLMEKKSIQIKRTVPYNPTKSREGLLISEDGKTIYDDSWMHPWIFEEDATKLVNASERSSAEHGPNINGIKLK
jgi:hypothetical protein